MNIHENTALLDAFVDGELTSEEMISVQSHLDECPECRAYVDDALAIRASFPTEDDLPLPADFTENVMRSVAKAPQSRPKRQPWGKLAVAAACLAVIVLVQHGTLGGVSGSSNTSAACDTAPMEAAAAESAPEERCLTTAGGDNAGRQQGRPCKAAPQYCHRLAADGLLARGKLELCPMGRVFRCAAGGGKAVPIALA